MLLRLMMLVLLSPLQPAMQWGLSNPPAAVHLRVASRRGSDSTGTGTAAAPFATLQRAQQAVRSAAASGPAGDIVVSVEPGRYFAPEPLHFTALDSSFGGGARSRTVFRGPSRSNSGSGDEDEALIYGGMLIPPAIWRRYQGNIWVANVSGVLPRTLQTPGPRSGAWGPNVSAFANEQVCSKGLQQGVCSEEGYPTDIPEVTFPRMGPPAVVRPFYTLLEGGRRATLARIPDVGSGYLGGNLSRNTAGHSCNVDGTTISCPPGVLPKASTFADDADDLTVMCHTSAGWFAATKPIVAPVEQNGNVTRLTFNGGGWDGICNNRTVLQGSKSFISEPGEWALDSGTGNLYLWPLNASAAEKGLLDVIVMTTPRVFDISGDIVPHNGETGSLAQRLDFQSLTFAGSDYLRTFVGDLWLRIPAQMREGMVRVENATDITLSGCRLRDGGVSAIWLEGYAQNIVIEECWIERIGWSGIVLNGPDPGATLGGVWKNAVDSYVNKNHRISGNVVFNVGTACSYGAGIWIYNSGDVEVEHNHIQESPRDGIGVYGSPSVPDPYPTGSPTRFYGKLTNFSYGLEQIATRSILIAWNRVLNVARNSADCGAIESAYTGYNNTAIHNCFSDMDRSLDMTTDWLNVLMPDDGSHFFNLSSNVIFSIHGNGRTEAAIPKSVGSVFAGNIVADSTLGYLLNLEPFTQPAANMIVRSNVWADIISSTDGEPEEPIDYGINNVVRGHLASAGPWATAPNGALFGFTNASTPSLLDPVISSFDNNTYWRVRHKPGDAWSGKWDTHAIIADPMFMHKGQAERDELYNRSCLDYSVTATSALWSQGFHKIDVENIGLLPSFPFDLSQLGRIDGLREKIQAERYQRMHGLWRIGGFGIAPGFGFANVAWARYDNIDVAHCGPVCNVEVLMSSMNGTRVELALGEPAPTAIVASAYVAKAHQLQLVSIPLVGAVDVRGQTVFLLLGGECHVDYFRFRATESVDPTF